MWREVTRKVWKTAGDTDVTGGFLALQLDARLGAPGPATAGTPYPFPSMLSVQSW
jgi:hypothetical protein